jgi:protein SCO1
MRSALPFPLVVLLLLAACSSEPQARQYELRGQVTGLAAEKAEVTIRHENIRGFMPAMTMPFKVSDRSLLDGIAPGDLVHATLNVTDDDAWLSALAKIGSAPLQEADLLASARVPLLESGAPLPDEVFVDQDGTERSISSFFGKALVITFTYTRCPLPMFCPLMDRNFAAIQKAAAADPALHGRVRLLTVSFDPAYDTPEVMKAHAASLGADPGVWTFLTADEETIDRFAGAFGVTILRTGDGPADITHSLRTVVADEEGRIVSVRRGNEWTPTQVLDDLRAVVRN